MSRTKGLEIVTLDLETCCRERRAKMKAQFCRGRLFVTAATGKRHAQSCLGNHSHYKITCITLKFHLKKRSIKGQVTHLANAKPAVTLTNTKPPYASFLASTNAKPYASFPALIDAKPYTSFAASTKRSESAPNSFTVSNSFTRNDTASYKDISLDGGSLLFGKDDTNIICHDTEDSGGSDPKL